MKALFYPAVMHSLVIGGKQLSGQKKVAKTLIIKGKYDLPRVWGVTNNHSKVYINENNY